MMCIMGQDIPWDQCISKYLQYLHPVGTLWICFLISDAIIPKKFAF